MHLLGYFVTYNCLQTLLYSDYDFIGVFCAVRSSCLQLERVLPRLCNWANTGGRDVRITDRYSTATKGGEKGEKHKIGRKINMGLEGGNISSILFRIILNSAKVIGLILNKMTKVTLFKLILNN